MMVFDVNQTEFASDYQHVIWQFGTHIVPLDVSLADVDDPKTREGCMQIYYCTMEILADMVSNLEDYKECPGWYTGDYLAWLVNGSKPMKKHSEEFFRYMQKIPQFGFLYDDDINAWTNYRYPLFCEYLPRLVSLAKERKMNLGGYVDRCDFRLFAKRITLTLDDLLRPLSDTDRAYALELHEYAIAKGMKVRKGSYTFRYIYKKLYSLEIHNNPFRILIPYRLDNGKYVPGQFERFLKIAESQPDANELIWYMQGGICVCNCCNGTKKVKERCKNWVEIRGERRLSSACHPAISKYRRGTRNPAYTKEDIRLLKRMMDLRILQLNGESDKTSYFKT